jgi:hypothetical protein
MHQKTLLLAYPGWHPSPEQEDVAVHWLRSPNGHQHLVAEAPNWANARKWGTRAALLAYTQLIEAKEPVANPCDPVEGLHVWVISPGFPLKTARLWEEPFGRYVAVPRNPPLVHPVLPTPGTDEARSGVPLSLEKAMATWGEAFHLCHPAAYGRAAIALSTAN